MLRCCEDSPHDNPSCFCGSFEDPPPAPPPVQACLPRPRQNRFKVRITRPRQSLLIQGAEIIELAHAFQRWLQSTVAQWLSADGGAAGAFQFQMRSGLSDGPTLPARCRCRAATEHRINNAHLVLHPIWNDELSSEKERQKGTNTEHDWRGRHY